MEGLKISIRSSRLKGVASLIATAELEKKSQKYSDPQNIRRLILSRPNANRVDESVKLEMQSLPGVWEKARTTGSPGRWG